MLTILLIALQVFFYFKFIIICVACSFGVDVVVIDSSNVLVNAC